MSTLTRQELVDEMVAELEDRLEGLFIGTEQRPIRVERLLLEELPPRLKYELENGYYLGSCDIGDCSSLQEGWALRTVEDTDLEWTAACERCGTGVRRSDPNAPPPERYIAFPTDQLPTPTEETK